MAEAVIILGGTLGNVEKKAIIDKPRHQVLRKKPLKKSLCIVAVKVLVELMRDTAAETAAQTRRQTKPNKPDHTLGDLWAEAVTNTVADTGRQCGHS